MMEVWIAVRASHSVSLATSIHYFIKFLVVSSSFVHAWGKQAVLFAEFFSRRHLGLSSFTASVSSCRRHVQVWWRWFPCIKGFRAGAASTGRFGRRIWRLKRRKRAGLGSRDAYTCCLHHWRLRFASSFTFMFPSLSGHGDGRCRPNLGSLSEVYLSLFATGQWCSMDPSCLNTWALPGQTEVQVTQLHLLGEAPLHGPQSLPLWLQRILGGSICCEFLLTSHLRPCNHPCGQSPWMLPWPWFHGAEQHQPNASKNCFTRSGITYSAASSASTVTEAIITNFQSLDWWGCWVQQLLRCMFHQGV